MCLTQGNRCLRASRQDGVELRRLFIEAGPTGFDPKQSLVAGKLGGEIPPIPDLGHPYTDRLS